MALYLVVNTAACNAAQMCNKKVWHQARGSAEGSVRRLGGSATHAGRHRFRADLFILILSFWGDILALLALQLIDHQPLSTFRWAY